MDNKHMEIIELDSSVVLGRSRDTDPFPPYVHLGLPRVNFDMQSHFVEIYHPTCPASNYM